MSTFDSVSDLYTAIQSYLDRNDNTIVSKIPLFVRMAEDELDRRLRHPAAIATANVIGSIGVNAIPSPKGLLELKHIRNLENGNILYRRSLEVLYEPIPNDDTQYPTAFAAQANLYAFNRPVSTKTSFQFLFYASPEKLSVSNASNLYLSACGDFLLYTATSNAFAYDANPEESAYFRQLAEQVFGTLQEQIDKEDMSGSTLVTFSNQNFIDTYF